MERIANTQKPKNTISDDVHSAIRLILVLLTKLGMDEEQPPVSNCPCCIEIARLRAIIDRLRLALESAREARTILEEHIAILEVDIHEATRNRRQPNICANA